jgi:hypothetical protein
MHRFQPQTFRPHICKECFAGEDAHTGVQPEPESPADFRRMSVRHPPHSSFQSTPPHPAMQQSAGYVVERQRAPVPSPAKVVHVEADCCPVCTKKVYLVEKVEAGGVKYHRMYALHM